MKKGRHEMRYEKPQIVRISPAINAIQYQAAKINGCILDMIWIWVKLTAIAYEADE